MGMNMAGEHCPNCGDELEDGQIGLCEACRDERAVGDAMLEKIGPVTIPPEVLATMPEDYGLSRRQIAERKRATHGSHELDADARKLEAMGQDAGATLADVEPDWKELFRQAWEIVCANADAWEGEENSVQEEHEELIERTGAFIDRTAAAAVQAALDVHMEGAHVDGE